MCIESNHLYHKSHNYHHIRCKQLQYLTSTHQIHKSHSHQYTVHKSPRRNKNLPRKYCKHPPQVLITDLVNILNSLLHHNFDNYKHNFHKCPLIVLTKINQLNNPSKYHLIIAQNLWSIRYIMNLIRKFHSYHYIERIRYPISILGLSTRSVHRLMLLS